MLKLDEMSWDVWCMMWASINMDFMGVWQFKIGRTFVLYCCRAVGLLIELRFELKSLTFDEVLTGIWRNLENSPINGRKVSFWHDVPSNTSKSMKKEVLREIFINMYDMGVWQFKIGKTTGLDLLT